MYRLVRAAALAAASALLLAAAAASAGPAGKPAAAPDRPAPPVKADRDGNKIFDDLESRLASAPADGQIEVIVTLAERASSERLADLESRVGQFAVARRFETIHGFSAKVKPGQVNALARVPWVAHVEENARVHKLNDTAQASFGVTKARADAPSLDGDADGSFATYSKGDLVAAVIDTGIDAGHQDLDEGKVIAFKDFVNNRTDAYDDEGHGTHVAATIAGDGDARADGLHRGVAPGAALVGAKVLDSTGSGSMDAVVAAIDWIVQNKDVYGIEAINLSLGAAGCSNGTTADEQAVNAAVAAGLVVAVAAGNEGAGTCTIGSPGAAARALTVGAMADLGAGGFRQAPFSSRGKTADGRIKPDISAPGVNITSALANSTNGYAAYSGTSMATPFAAGVALLMRDANPALTPDDVKAKLVATAIDWGRGGDNTVAGTTGADVDYGAGRMDAYAALASAGASLTAPPAAPKHELREGTLSGTGARVDYKFDVADLSFPIAATLIIPAVKGATATNPDFDLYLYDPAGTRVAAAETIDRQEDVAFKPTVAGTYTLRVYSYAGSGGFFVDISAGIGTPPAPAPAPTPQTVTVFPSSTTINAGSLRAGDYTRLAADDDVYYQVNSTTWGTRVADWYGRMKGVSNALTGLELTYRGKSSVSCTQALYVYNWTTGTWVTVDSGRAVGTTEVQVAVKPAGTLADYVSGTSGDGDVAFRVRCVRGDYTSFFVSGDLMKAVFSKP